MVCCYQCQGLLSVNVLTRNLLCRKVTRKCCLPFIRSHRPTLTNYSFWFHTYPNVRGFHLYSILQWHFKRHKPYVLPHRCTFGVYCVFLFQFPLHLSHLFSFLFFFIFISFSSSTSSFLSCLSIFLLLVNRFSSFSSHLFFIVFAHFLRLFFSPFVVVSVFSRGMRFSPLISSVLSICRLYIKRSPINLSFLTAIFSFLTTSLGIFLLKKTLTQFPGQSPREKRISV